MGFKFTRYSNSNSGFTVFGWIKKQNSERDAIKSLPIKDTYLQFGIRSVLDFILACGLSALTYPIGLIMNIDVTNPFLVIFGVMMMIIPLFLPIVFIFRGITFGILQISINKKWLGFIGLIGSILSLPFCVFMWIIGLM